MSDLFTLLKLATVARRKYVVDRCKARENASLIADFAKELSTFGESAESSTSNKSNKCTTESEGKISENSSPLTRLPTNRKPNNRTSLLAPPIKELAAPGRPSDDQAEEELNEIDDLIAPKEIQKMLKEYQKFEHDDYLKKYQLKTDHLRSKDYRAREEYVLFVETPSFLKGPVISNQSLQYQKFHKQYRNQELSRLEKQERAEKNEADLKKLKEKKASTKEWFEQMSNK